tara:strand:- start:876 stop:1610 length:735 start_codon:yes stop_codon:yes gene_type:complete
MPKAKFGYKEVDTSKKPQMVNEIFTSVSNKYDVMNDLMSFGLHRNWKKQFIRVCNIPATKKVLDIACGTGDIAYQIRGMNPSVQLTCLDPNKEMIEICKQKLINKGITNVMFHIKSIEDFDPKNEKYDLITLSFGLRNFTNHTKALKKVYDMLTPGGKFVVLDFKKPRNKVYSKIFKIYTLNLIPKLGKIVANDEDSYRYLGESIQTYYSPEEIKEMFEKVGFIQTKKINLPEDVATIHIGYRS